MVAVVILGIIAFVGLCVLLYFRRLPRVGELTVVTGGVKSGKTMACVYWTYKKHLCNMKKYGKAYRRAIRRGTLLPERPLLYSNMPIRNISTVLTSGHVRKRSRFNYGSTVYLNEASLVAPSLDVKDNEKNKVLLEFFKLISHELHGGGGCFIDTQAWEDCHFSIKRSVSTVLYIEKAQNLLLHRAIKVRELHPNMPETPILEREEETPLSDSGCHWYLLPKSTWRLYDCYAYSGLTDKLPLDNTPHTTPDDLKVYRHSLVTLDKEESHNEKT